MKYYHKNSSMHRFALALGTRLDVHSVSYFNVIVITCHSAITHYR